MVNSPKLPNIPIAVRTRSSRQILGKRRNRFSLKNFCGRIPRMTMTRFEATGMHFREFMHKNVLSQKLTGILRFISIWLFDFEKPKTGFLHLAKESDLLRNSYETFPMMCKRLWTMKADLKDSYQTENDIVSSRFSLWAYITWSNNWFWSLLSMFEEYWN